MRQVIALFFCFYTQLIFGQFHQMSSLAYISKDIPIGNNGSSPFFSLSDSFSFNGQLYYEPIFFTDQKVMNSYFGYQMKNQSIFVEYNSVGNKELNNYNFSLGYQRQLSSQIKLGIGFDYYEAKTKNKNAYNYFDFTIASFIKLSNLSNAEIIFKNPRSWITNNYKEYSWLSLRINHKISSKVYLNFSIDKVLLNPTILRGIILYNFKSNLTMITGIQIYPNAFFIGFDMLIKQTKLRFLICNQSLLGQSLGSQFYYEKPFKL